LLMTTRISGVLIPELWKQLLNCIILIVILQTYSILKPLSSPKTKTLLQ